MTTVSSLSKEEFIVLFKNENYLDNTSKCISYIKDNIDNYNDILIVSDSYSEENDYTNMINSFKNESDANKIQLYLLYHVENINDTYKEICEWVESQKLSASDGKTKLVIFDVESFIQIDEDTYQYFKSIFSKLIHTNIKIILTSRDSTKNTNRSYSPLSIVESLNIKIKEFVY